MERNDLKNIRFRLLQFKKLARWLSKKLPPPLAYFLLGYLQALESSIINAKAMSAVETAIARHRRLERPLKTRTTTSTPSEVEGLDIIEIKSNYERR